METLSVSLALWVRNQPINAGSPTAATTTITITITTTTTTAAAAATSNVMWSFGDGCVLGLNMLFNKQGNCWWFIRFGRGETPWCSCDVTVMIYMQMVGWMMHRNRTPLQCACNGIVCVSAFGMVVDSEPNSYGLAWLKSDPPMANLSWHVYQWGPAAILTNDVSFVIQIRWKFRFSLIHILLDWSLQNFAHDTTAVLSWHVQNCVAIW